MSDVLKNFSWLLHTSIGDLYENLNIPQKIAELGGELSSDGNHVFNATILPSKEFVSKEEVLICGDQIYIMVPRTLYNTMFCFKHTDSHNRSTVYWAMYADTINLRTGSVNLTDDDFVMIYITSYKATYEEYHDFSRELA